MFGGQPVWSAAQAIGKVRESARGRGVKRGPPGRPHRKKSGSAACSGGPRVRGTALPSASDRPVERCMESVDCHKSPSAANDCSRDRVYSAGPFSIIVSMAASRSATHALAPSIAATSKTGVKSRSTVLAPTAARSRLSAKQDRSGSRAAPGDAAFPTDDAEVASATTVRCANADNRPFQGHVPAALTGDKPPCS